MAKFDPVLNPTQDPNYSVPEGPKAVANTSLGTLFSGIGSVAGEGVKAADSIFKDKIKSDLRTRLENEQDQNFGVAAATDIAATGQNPTGAQGDSGSIASIMNPGSGTGGVTGGKTGKGTPAGVQRLGETLTGFKEAYEQGSWGNSLYLGRMNSAIKQTIAQYPGYKEEIITMGTEILGTNSQNALRKSLVDDMDAHARASQGQVSKDEAFVRSHIDEFGEQEGPAIWQQYKAGKLNVDQFTQLWAARKGVSNDITLARSKLGLVKDTTEANQTNVAGTFTGLASSLVMNTMSNRVAGTGMSYPEIQQAIINQPDKPMSAAQTMKVTQSYNALRTKQEAELYVQANTIDQRSGKSFAWIMGPEKTQQAIAAAMKPFDQLSDAITNQKNGIAGAWAAHNEAMKEERTAKMLEGNDTLANMEVINKVGGQAGLNIVLSTVQQGKSNFPAVVTGLNQAFAYKLHAGKVDSLGAEVKAIPVTATPEERAKLTFMQVETAAKTLVEPKVSEQAFRSTAKSVFGDKNIGFVGQFDGDTQPKVFARLASPDISKKVMASGDPQLINQYQKWTTNTFAGLYRQSAQDLQRSGIENERFEVRLEDGQYKATIRPQYANRYPNGVPMSVQGPINRINEGIRTIRPIIGDDNLHKSLVDVLSTMGIKPEARPVDKPLPRDSFQSRYDANWLKPPSAE